MNLINSLNRDSDFLRCLFQFFQDKQMPIQALYPIKPSILFVKTNQLPLVVKKFSSQSILQNQMRFLQLLHETGFNNTYTFVEGIPPFIYNGDCFGFLHYIPPHAQPFRFNSLKACQEGLQLLDEFHAGTKRFTAQFLGKIPHFNQTQKWMDRLTEFQTNLPIMQQFLDRSILSKFAEIGTQALEQLRFFQAYGIPVIIHGDVAHHNFLRVRNGQLYLIDFDLIAYAPAMLDILQYANRILPMHDCSLTAIRNYPEISRYLQQPYFLHGLSFPSDIFREWNRLGREANWQNKQQIEMVVNFTKNQFPGRLRLFNEITAMLK